MSTVRKHLYWHRIESKCLLLLGLLPIIVHFMFPGICTLDLLWKFVGVVTWEKVLHFIGDSIHAQKHEENVCTSSMQHILLWEYSKNSFSLVFFVININWIRCVGAGRSKIIKGYIFKPVWIVLWKWMIVWMNISLTFLFRYSRMSSITLSGGIMRYFW